MTIIEEDGKKYVMLKVEVKDFDEARKGDYVLYRGQVYRHAGYDYDYTLLEKEDGTTIEVGP